MPLLTIILMRKIMRIIFVRNNILLTRVSLHIYLFFHFRWLFYLAERERERFLISLFKFFFRIAKKELLILLM